MKFIRDQKSYSNHTASHTTNHTAMTPPERIAVQQSYNLLTAISLGGVRPIRNLCVLCGLLCGSCEIKQNLNGN